MKTKFTPGPWTMSTHDDNDDVVIRDTAGAILANCTVDATRDYGMTEKKHREIVMANAHLIAAAPDLYEALFTHGHPSVAKILRIHGYKYEALKIEAAIAKAEGGQDEN